MRHPDRLRTITVTTTTPNRSPEMGLPVPKVQRAGFSGSPDQAMVLWLVRLSIPWGEDRVTQYVCGLGVDLPSHIPIGEVGPIVARLNP